VPSGVHAVVRAPDVDLPVVRDSHTTSWPSAARRAVRAEPRNPLPPAMTIFMLEGV
jgi:hypothetical protein